MVQHVWLPRVAVIIIFVGTTAVVATSTCCEQFFEIRRLSLRASLYRSNTGRPKGLHFSLERTYFQNILHVRDVAEQCQLAHDLLEGIANIDGGQHLVLTAAAAALAFAVRSFKDTACRLFWRTVTVLFAFSKSESHGGFCSNLAYAKRSQSLSCFLLC